MNFFEITKQYITSEISIIDAALSLAGLVLLCIWAVKTSFGRKALADSQPRPNSMPPYLPLIPMFIWYGGVMSATSIKDSLLGDLPSWQSTFLDSSLLCIGAIVAMAVTIYLAKTHFAQQLKGFGLNVKTIHKDFFAAIVNLVSVWPILMVTVVLTTLIGKVIWGADFRLAQHQELESLATYSQWSIRLLIIITAVIIVPAFEEMLFRGMFQTMIRSILVKPWASIAICSAFFAVLHANAGHWPTLFFFSMCLGYAYEKSGSLFRSIFIHSLFNTISIIATLSQ